MPKTKPAATFCSLFLLLSLLSLLTTFASIAHSRANPIEKIGSDFYHGAAIRSTLSNSDIPTVFSPVRRWVRKLLGIKPKPIEEGGPADVTKLKLSAAKITLPCNPETRGNRQLIEITVEAYDRYDVLTYVYNPSAGKIIGEGPNVMWDLTGVPPGTYTLAAGANDGCGVCGLTKIEKIEILKDTRCGATNERSIDPNKEG